MVKMWHVYIYYYTAKLCICCIWYSWS